MSRALVTIFFSALFRKSVNCLLYLSLLERNLFCEKINLLRLRFFRQIVYPDAYEPDRLKPVVFFVEENFCPLKKIARIQDIQIGCFLYGDGREVAVANFYVKPCGLKALRRSGGTSSPMKDREGRFPVFPCP